MSGAEPIDRHDFWLHSLRGWDLALAALCGVYLLAALLVPDTWQGRGTSLGAVAVIAAAYVAVGRPGLVGARRGRIVAYLAVLVMATALAIASSDGGFILLFAAFSHIWYMSWRRWQGVLWSIALAVLAVVAVVIARVGSSTSWTDSATQMAASLVFAVTIGLWTTQLAENGEEQAALLRRLHEAQDELAASERTAGVLAERERLAQEIHDTLAQGFTSIVMLSQTAAALLDRDRAEEAAVRVAQVEHVARENLAEARALVAAFGPVALQGATLAQALARLADRFEAETGTQVAIELDAQAAEIDAEVAVALLRTAQEGLANVRRHAQARHVVLRLVHADGCVTIDLADDGRGLPADLREGVGLSGVRERAAAGGGSVELAAAPGGGTRLRLTLPVAS